MLQWEHLSASPTGTQKASRPEGSEVGQGGGREGGSGPKFLAERYAHTPYLARPCLRSRSQPPRPGGHPAPAGAPSSVPTCQGVSRLFGVLLQLLNKSFVCWCCAALGRPALRDVPRCRCHRRSLPSLVPAVSRGTEIRPSALVFQNQCLTGLFALPSSHGRGTAGHQHPLEMSQHPHTSSVSS